MLGMLGPSLPLPVASLVSILSTGALMGLEQDLASPGIPIKLESWLWNTSNVFWHHPLSAT